MRHLLLLRHAKSSWQSPELADAERPLNRRGERAADRLGAYLLEQGLLPDLALVSTARRTQQTWQRLSRRWPPPAVPAESHDSLYLAPPNRLLAQIRGVPDPIRRLLLIGHNPGLESLALRLAGTGSDAAARERLARKYPTGGLAVFLLDCPTWRALDPGRSRLERFVAPRDLAGDGGED